MTQKRPLTALSRLRSYFLPPKSQNAPWRPSLSRDAAFACFASAFFSAHPPRWAVPVERGGPCPTIAALPAAQRRSSSSPTTRRSRNAISSRPAQTLSSCCARTRCSHPRPRKSASCSLLTTRPAALTPAATWATRPRPQNHHRWLSR
jgi:hypothetical protein